MEYLVEFINAGDSEVFTAKDDNEAIAVAHDFDRCFNDWTGYAPAVVHLIPAAIYRKDEWGKFNTQIY